MPHDLPVCQLVFFFLFFCLHNFTICPPSWLVFLPYDPVLLVSMFPTSLYLSICIGLASQFECFFSFFFSFLALEHGSFFFSSFPSFHTVFQVGLFLNLMVYVPVSQFFLLLLFSSPIFIGLANQRELGEFFQFYFFYLFLGTRLRFRDVVRCLFFSLIWSIYWLVHLVVSDASLIVLVPWGFGCKNVYTF